MSDRARFTLMLTLMDEHHEQQSLTIVIPVDQAVGIRNKPAFELEAGMLRFDDVVEIIRTRELRRDLFVSEARRLGALLADRMEDAEGWHDASRVEPARRSLGLTP